MIRIHSFVLFHPGKLTYNVVFFEAEWIRRKIYTSRRGHFAVNSRMVHDSPQYGASRYPLHSCKLAKVPRMYDGTATRSWETRIVLAVEMRPFSPTREPPSTGCFSARVRPPLPTCHRTFSSHPSPRSTTLLRIIVSFPFFFTSFDAPVCYVLSSSAHELNPKLLMYVLDRRVYATSSATLPPS